MTKSASVLLFCGALTVPAMALHSAASFPPPATLHMGVCEVGSACRSCVERHEVKVWREGSQVLISGQDSAGRPLLEPLLDCQFQGSFNWSCSTGQHRVESRGGKLRFISATHSRTSGHEWCDLGE